MESNIHVRCSYTGADEWRQNIPLEGTVVGTSRALGQVQDPTALHGSGPGDGHRRHREDCNHITNRWSPELRLVTGHWGWNFHKNGLFFLVLVWGFLFGFGFYLFVWVLEGVFLRILFNFWVKEIQSSTAYPTSSALWSLLGTLMPSIC